MDQFPPSDQATEARDTFQRSVQHFRLANASNPQFYTGDEHAGADRLVAPDVVAGNAGHEQG